MSNEGSGPEDNSDGVRVVWTSEMAKKAGLMEGVDLDSMSFLEVIKCPWQSQELSDIYHELYELWHLSLTAKQKERLYSNKYS
ncbi:hypothetical protein PAXRUDRAFT_161969 [Paxillus rubicundulus Ve08.2h10]|uniref:Uncharacterized protein n=1 Tax=Paxillus rubicundulus Ve08.2h10 TaxID=930991 RepID=A0A0D0CUQ0_9AGAM|nr:hypothetical protein PAXRUDRAFT_161969 [Paxillus rubicundulus Ve08.2h10]